MLDGAWHGTHGGCASGGQYVPGDGCGLWAISVLCQIPRTACSQSRASVALLSSPAGSPVVTLPSPGYSCRSSCSLQSLEAQWPPCFGIPMAWGEERG